MSESLHGQLSRRESQIMNIIYARQEATAEEVRRRMPDPPSNATVRTTLRTLEEKGHLRHYKKGRQYVYKPTVPRQEARQSVLQHVVKTFFGGSMPEAVATLLSMSESELSEEELQRLLARIDQRQEEEEENQ